jgi:hypothetical protein
MKVIHNVKNILIQEFQHSLESRLIEVMIYKMRQIQFVLSMNLIQTQSTQAPNLLSYCQTGQLADTSSER